jgi:myo-inositol 2-dehydrogenase/D-chiro-inositol 1-dehydrogenase
MATTLNDAKKILKAAQKSKSVYQIGLNERFAKVYKFAKERIDMGFVPYSAHIKMNRGELKNPSWVINKAVTGGFLFESTIHLIDMARYLVGEVESVYCKAKASVYDQLDDFAMIFTFKEGAHATFMSCAHTTWLFPFERIELYGDHEQIVTEELDMVRYTSGVLHEPLIGNEVVVKEFRLMPFAEKRGYREEDRMFIDAVVNGTPPAVSAEVVRLPL